MSDSPVEVLQGRIAALSDLYSQIQALRQIPPSLLKRHTVATGLALPSQSIADRFQQVRDVATLVRSEPIQAAFNDAEKRLRADSSNLNTNHRRENRKRRRPPSPESPKPYVPAEKTPVSLLPPPDGAPAVTLETLIDYTREFNKRQAQDDNPCRLHIWERTKEQAQGRRPHMMRFSIPDVLTAYMRLGFAGADKTVLVQAVMVFGPRELKAPHTQSDFTVFRLLSQELAKMIRATETVELRTLVRLLGAYEGLFVTRCTACGAVLSGEGHVPAVVRLWTGGAAEARHVTCVDE